MVVLIIDFISIYARSFFTEEEYLHAPLWRTYLSLLDKLSCSIKLSFVRSFYHSSHRVLETSSSPSRRLPKAERSGTSISNLSARLRNILVALTPSAHPYASLREPVQEIFQNQVFLLAFGFLSVD